MITINSKKKVDIYKRANQNKKENSKSATKIQAFVRGIQFRTNVLPNILFQGSALKRFSN